MGITTKSAKNKSEKNGIFSKSVSDIDHNNGTPAIQKGVCSNCNTEARCSRRHFSEQAWTVLLLWNEIHVAAIDKPICNDCYEELREILIDRTDEIEKVMEQKDEVAKIREKIGGLAS